MIKEINKSLIISWCQKNQIDLCIMFGSFASGQVHANSDVDIALFSDKRDCSIQKLQLIGDLETIIKATVDLVILHADVSPLLQYEIMVKGKPLYISDREIYIKKLIYAIKLYNDVAFLNKWRDLSLSIQLKRLKNVTSSY